MAVEFFEVLVCESDRAQWPAWLSSRNGRFVISTLVQEYEDVVSPEESLGVLRDRIKLRLGMGARVEPPNNSVVTTTTTSTEIAFYARFTEGIARALGVNGKSDRRQRLYSVFAGKIDRLSQLQDLSDLMGNLPQVAIGRRMRLAPDKEDLLLGELLCAPFCLVASLSYMNKLADAAPIISSQNDVQTHSLPNGTLYASVLYSQELKPVTDVTIRLNSAIPDDVAFGLARIVSTFPNCERPHIRAAVDDVTPMAHPAVSALSQIKYHREGGVIPLPTWQRIAAVLYTIASIAAAVCVAAFNVAGRSNSYERMTDGVATAGFFLFTVVGLVKLSSEDANIIRNTILGKRILRCDEEVVSALGLHDIADLKRAICHPDNDALEWLDAQDCCYAGANATGTIRVHGGMSLLDFRKTGAVIISDRVFRRVRDDFGFFLRIDHDLLGSILPGSQRKVGPDYQLIAVTARLQ